MLITIKRKDPLFHSLKVAIAVLTIFFLVIFVVNLRKANKTQDIPDIKSIPATIPSSLVPVITLPVEFNRPESEWINALAKAFQGRIIADVEFEHFDIMTDEYAIKVDFFNNWAASLEQTLHYISKTDLIPVMALVSEKQPTSEQLRQIEKTTASKCVRLVLLEQRP